VSCGTNIEEPCCKIAGKTPSGLELLKDENISIDCRTFSPLIISELIGLRSVGSSLFYLVGILDWKELLLKLNLDYDSGNRFSVRSPNSL